MAPTSTIATERAAQSTSQRIARWVEENRTLAFALGVGTVAVGGAGAYYYYYGGDTARRPPRGDGNDAFSDEKGGASSSKKKKSKKGKKTSGGAASPAGAAKAGSSSGSPNADGLPRDPAGPLLEEASDNSLIQVPIEEIEALPEERRKSLAQALKTAGNKAYSTRAFERAIEFYTKAVAAQPLAVFYSNRAACYANLGRPADVIPDCNAALERDATYIKALNRRAVAREQLGGDASEEGAEGDAKRALLFDALADFTAVAILGHFQDQTATESVERVLKKIATSKAKEILRTREPKLPSPTFVTAYLEAFRKRPLPTLPVEASEGDQELLRAFDAINERDYERSLELVDAAVTQGLSNHDLEAVAYNLRGTFKFVIGNAKGALDDLERSTSLRPAYVQSWVKKASVHMELSDKDEAFRDFETAIAADADDPDIYYHRGQVHFILGEFDRAIEDYQKSTSLDDGFIFSQVQYAVAQYKLGNVAQSTASFRKLLRTFEGSSEAYNYYGELLLDQQRFEEALEKFDRAIDIEAAKPRSSNVLPSINKALALFQWKQDMASAEQLCRAALERDPDCDVAVATLAQLSLQQGKIRDAIDFFERSARIARTEPELINAITYENASRAQLKFIHDFPEQGKALSAMAGGLA